MKNYNYLFTIFLSSFLFISCSEDAIEGLEEKITTGELTSFSVDKNNLFTDENANLLIYNTEDYPTVQVTSSSTDKTVSYVIIE